MIIFFGVCCIGEMQISTRKYFDLKEIAHNVYQVSRAKTHDAIKHTTGLTPSLNSAEAEQVIGLKSRLDPPNSSLTPAGPTFTAVSKNPSTSQPFLKYTSTSTSSSTSSLTPTAVRSQLQRQLALRPRPRGSTVSS